MPPLPDLEEELQRIAGEAERQGILLRLMGGLAVHVQSPSTARPPFQRSYGDLDYVCDPAGAARLEPFFSGLGYAPDRRLNTLNGDRRQLYLDEAHARHVDIFIGALELCHKIPLAGRLRVEPLTLPLAELFLSKIQIVQLNRKDAQDLLALLLDHPASDGDAGTINLEIVCGLCAKDWGLYTTLSLNLRKLAALLEPGEFALAPDKAERLRERIASLQSAVDDAPKSMAWKLRARIGTKMRWYEEVEEVER